MTDLRTYNDTVRASVARERKEDANWSWNVKAVNKSIIKIGWGYLDYIGESDCFTVTLDEDEFVTTVIGTIPSGNNVYIFVGPDRWHDVDNIESGIAAAIHAMATIAHRTY